jgi:hypothetical protein
MCYVCGAQVVRSSKHSMRPLPQTGLPLSKATRSADDASHFVRMSVVRPGRFRIGFTAPGREQ